VAAIRRNTALAERYRAFRQLHQRRRIFILRIYFAAAAAIFAAGGADSTADAGERIRSSGGQEGGAAVRSFARNQISPTDELLKDLPEVEIGDAEFIGQLPVIDQFAIRLQGDVTEGLNRILTLANEEEAHCNSRLTCLNIWGIPGLSRGLEDIFRAAEGGSGLVFHSRWIKFLGWGSDWSCFFESQDRSFAAEKYGVKKIWDFAEALLRGNIGHGGWGRGATGRTPPCRLAQWLTREAFLLLEEVV